MKCCAILIPTYVFQELWCFKPSFAELDNFFLFWHKNWPTKYSDILFLYKFNMECDATPPLIIHKLLLLATNKWGFHLSIFQKVLFHLLGLKVLLSSFNVLYLPSTKSWQHMNHDPDWVSHDIKMLCRAHISASILIINNYIWKHLTHPPWALCNLTKWYKFTYHKFYVKLVTPSFLFNFNFYMSLLNLQMFSLTVPL